MRFKKEEFTLENGGKNRKATKMILMIARVKVILNFTLKKSFTENKLDLLINKSQAQLRSREILTLFFINELKFSYFFVKMREIKFLGMKEVSK